MVFVHANNVQYSVNMSTADGTVTGGVAEGDNAMDQEQVDNQNEAQDQSQNSHATSTRTKKVANPFVSWGKSAASGSIEGTICGLWCHNNCTGLSKDFLRNLAAQAKEKEIGVTFWACTACMNFNSKWNSQMRETHQRQDNMDKKVETNRQDIEENRRRIEEGKKLAD